MADGVSVVEHVAEVTVANSLGLHARPAVVIVEAAREFECELWLDVHGTKVSAKSIMGILMLGAEAGALMKITGRGPDAREAVERLAALVREGLREE